jgi:hypothetical protein
VLELHGITLALPGTQVPRLQNSLNTEVAKLAQYGGCKTPVTSQLSAICEPL